MSDQQPTFAIEKIYVKDLSVENPNAPQSYLSQEQPQVEISLQTRGQRVDEGYYEVVLIVTVTARQGENTVFLVEAAQAGLFQIRDIPEADLQPILGIHCPTILFPYARETISSAIGRAGYPAVLLNPISFEQLYQEQMREAQTQQQPGELPVQ